MMQAVRGIYRDGVVELLEKPAVTGDAEVVVTFLSVVESYEDPADQDTHPPVYAEDAPGLDDFEPFAPAQPHELSDIVLEERR